MRWAVADTARVATQCLGWEEVPMLDQEAMRLVVTLGWVVARHGRPVPVASKAFCVGCADRSTWRSLRPCVLARFGAAGVGLHALLPCSIDRTRESFPDVSDVRLQDFRATATMRAEFDHVFGAAISRGYISVGAN